MGAYVKRAAVLFGARVSLIHVFNPDSYSGLELYVRTPSEIAEEHLEIAREKLDSFLQEDFPIAHCSRILAAGEAAKHIAETARKGFDLIIMPTHAGTFRRMLLGSTTAKVLNDADCPVVTSKHADAIHPRPLNHREWLCAIGMGENSERVLRYARRASVEARANLRIIHAIQVADSGVPALLDLEEQISLRKRSKFASRWRICRRESIPRHRFGSPLAPLKKRYWKLPDGPTPTRSSSEEALNRVHRGACGT